MVNSWKRTGGDNQTNAEIAASGNESIRFTRAPDPRNFNWLDAKNASAVEIELRLNGNNTTGFLFILQPGESASFDQDTGVYFDFVQVVNRNTTTVAAVSTVVINVAKFERVS